MSAARHPELGAIEVPGLTRGDFILRGTLATAALYGAGAAAPFVERALAQTAQSDLTILSFALSLENLEIAFYKAATSKAKLSARTKKLASEFGNHEQQHQQALSGALQALGGKAPASSTPKFDVTDDASFLKLAVTLEEIGVGAYNGAAPSLKSPDLLATAGAIVQTEARHAAALRELAGQDPSPAAFDTALTTAQVTARVKPFAGP